MGRLIRVNGELYEEVEVNREDFRKVSNRYRRFSGDHPTKWSFERGTTRGHRWVGLFSSSFDVNHDLDSVAVVYMDPDDYGDGPDDPRSSSITTIVVDPGGKRGNTDRILGVLQSRGFGVKSTRGNAWANRSLVRNTPLERGELERLTKVIDQRFDWPDE